MSLKSSKSPDPPEGALDVATGEDSQESTTLHNAMQPMPDTQSDSQDSQRISPENYAIPAAPFISRPVQPDADDLSIGFTFDKPSTVTPGQFSGRKPPKAIIPMEIASGPGLSTEPPFQQKLTLRSSTGVDEINSSIPTRLPSPQEKRVIQDPSEVPAAQNLSFPLQGSRISNPIQSYQCPQITQDVSSGSLPRKKPPFADYQPAYRALNPQRQMPTPGRSFQGPAPDQNGSSFLNKNLACRKAADIQQSHKLDPVDSGFVNAPQQKSRMSFQNDVSVSSAQPPRSMPGSSPSTAMVCRPIKNNVPRTSRLNTPARRSRSAGPNPRSSRSIVKSNSKAKRTSHNAHVSSSSRASSRCAHHGDTTPSMLQRSKWTPAELLQERFHQKLATTATDLAGCFNDKFADIQAEVDHHLQTIADLKKGMSKQRNEMSRYKERMLGKDDKIQQLEKDCHELLAKVDTTNQEIETRSTRISKLEEKCRSYKEFLNNAIAEQQALYKATKAKCEGTITQMRVEENNRNALQERERKHAEATREKLNQLVMSTVTEYKQKEREFDNQIETLKQKVQVRDADILRERETAQALLQQNGNISSIQDTLKTFGVQIEEVVGKVNQVVAQQSQQDDPSTKDLHVKLDQVMQSLQALDERTLPAAALSKEMHELNEKTLVLLSEKLEPILAAQLQTKISLDSLCSGVEACINDIWTELEDRQIMLEEYCFKQDVEREQRVTLLQQQMEEVQGDLDQQNQLFLQSEQTVREREKTIDKLEADIADLAQAHAQHAAESTHLDRLREECATLKDDAAAKASVVSELERKLQKSTEDLAAEAQKHQEHNDGLHRLMEQRVAEAKAAHVSVVEAAQRDAMLKMNEIKADIDARLTQALEQRTALQQELDEAKRKIKDIEAESSSMSEKATTLEEALQSSRAEALQDRKQASLKDAEQQAAKEQQLKLIQDLQTQLASTEEKFNTVADNAKAYDGAAQTVLLALKQWTQNFVTIQDMANELRKERAQNGIPNQIDSRFKPLFEMQLLQMAVSQYCQTQKEAARMLPKDPATVKTASQGFATMGSLQKAAGRVLDQMRQVTVMSPASNASSPQPPSVQIEQERRRTGQLPKSILKLVSQDQQGNEDEPRRELLSHTSLNRGPYNRFVAGGKPRTGMSIARLRQRAGLGSENNAESEAGNAPNIGETRKRKQDLEQLPDSKRVSSLKREKSPFSAPGFSSPPGRANGELDGSQVPRAPREAGWRATINSEQLASSAFSQSSQEQSQSLAITIGSRFSTGNLFKTRTNSNDPLALFHQRRRAIRANEESQESFKHSQDLGDEAFCEIPRSRQYSFGP